MEPGLGFRIQSLRLMDSSGPVLPSFPPPGTRPESRLTVIPSGVLDSGLPSFHSTLQTPHSPKPGGLGRPGVTRRAGTRTPSLPSPLATVSIVRSPWSVLSEPVSQTRLSPPVVFSNSIWPEVPVRAPSGRSVCLFGNHSSPRSPRVSSHDEVYERVSLESLVGCRHRVRKVPFLTR